MWNESIFLVWGILVFSGVLLSYRFGRAAGLIGFLIICALLMNIFVLKQFEVFGVLITGGNILYGAMFLGTDILNEHHGRSVALKSVFLSFLAMIGFVIATQVLLLWNTPSFVEFDLTNSMTDLFSLAPRIVLASLFTFAFVQCLDVFLFDRIRQSFKGLWKRNIGSTLVSQAIDTIVFTALGLTIFSWLPLDGVLPVDIFWEVVFGTYVVKIVVALLDTPFIYASYWITGKKNPSR